MGKKFFYFVGFVIVLLVGYTIFNSGPTTLKEAPYVFDKIEISKSRRLMKAFVAGKVVKEYRIDLGFNPIGHKEQEGDGKTPEGFYKIESKNGKSRFHLALKISYPNNQDKEKARSKGVSPGGDIMIHGLPNKVPAFASFILGKDWTLGCVAVNNDEIEEIYAATPVGTIVEIKP